MNAKALSLCACVGIMLALALLFETVSSTLAEPGGDPPTCSYTYATTATGSCGRPPDSYDCPQSNGDKASCLNTKVNYVDVKQDFPTDCPKDLNVKYDCKIPDQDCWRSVVCKYEDDGTCVIDQDLSASKVWNKKPKRESKKCP